MNTPCANHGAQRVARAGQGRCGGYRMLLASQARHRAVFLYGFAKNERENIGNDELQTLREIGAAWLAASAPRIARAIQENFPRFADRVAKHLPRT